MRQTHLKWWPEQVALKSMSNLSGILPSVEAALRKLKEGGSSGKTLQNYVDSLRSFLLWCEERDYLDCNPLKKLKPFDTTPKTTRRALLLEEIQRLFAVAPEYRRLLYGAAICTGLRANELRSLDVSHLNLESRSLQLDSAWTKNRKPGFQPIPSRLIAELQVFINEKSAMTLYEKNFNRCDSELNIPENPLLYVPVNVAREMNGDLKKANIPKCTPKGKIDFHSCRVTYISFLVSGGANVKEAQTLARHSTPFNHESLRQNDRFSPCRIDRKVRRRRFITPKVWHICGTAQKRGHSTF